MIVLLIPGPGVLYVVARSLDQGLRAGLVSALGLAAGAFVHVVAATAGLSAILLTSSTAFGMVKLVGAAYLIYLGIKVFDKIFCELIIDSVLKGNRGASTFCHRQCGHACCRIIQVKEHQRRL